MFNKIIVSVVSSVFMFACSVKDSSDGDVTSAADVVSSELPPVPEVAGTTSTAPTVSSDPVTSTQVSQPAVTLPSGEVTGGVNQPTATGSAVVNLGNVPAAGVGVVTPNQPITPALVPVAPSATVK
jgi:hypothetical protein